MVPELLSVWGVQFVSTVKRLKNQLQSKKAKYVVRKSWLYGQFLYEGMHNVYFMNTNSGQQNASRNKCRRHIKFSHFRRSFQSRLKSYLHIHPSRIPSNHLLYNMKALLHILNHSEYQPHRKRLKHHQL